ncbi:MAG: SNF2-related protein [Chthoniobacter sp.]
MSVRSSSRRPPCWRIGKNELARFAPSLRAGFLHPSETPASEWRDAAAAAEFLVDKDVVLTTYGQAARLDWLTAQEWRLIVLDEAHAIKNPGARQNPRGQTVGAPGPASP